MAGDLHLCDRQVWAGMCAMTATHGQHQQHLHQYLPLKQRKWKRGDVQLQYIKSDIFLLPSVWPRALLCPQESSQLLYESLTQVSKGVLCRLGFPEVWVNISKQSPVRMKEEMRISFLGFHLSSVHNDLTTTGVNQEAQGMHVAARATCTAGTVPVVKCILNYLFCNVRKFLEFFSYDTGGKATMCLVTWIALLWFCS